ncbi:MAG TPA: hypothetical protein VGB07_36230 [Blastocatellia bacterium]
MLTERETITESSLPDYNQLPAEPSAEKPTRKRKAKPRRRVREEKAPEPNQVKVNASFSMPVEQLAQLAQSPEEEEDEDNEEEIEEAEEAYPRDNRHLLYGPGLASVPFQPRLAADDHSESVREHLRQVSEANAFKAKIWRVPEGFARRNPLIQRKPSNPIGWSYQGEFSYDPETLDDDLLSMFSDGHYFVEIREHGRFVQGLLKTVGDPSSSETVMPPTVQAAVHEHAPPDPLKEAKANAFAMNAVVDAATRLAEVAAHQQPAQHPKPQTLKERLEELKLMQQMFAPPQPQAQQQHDPLEKLASALEGETLKRILSSIKSENPVAPVEPSTTIWDWAMEIVPHVAPGLNALMAGAGVWLRSLGQQPVAINQQPAQTAPQKPSQLPQPAPPQPEPPIEEPATEGEGVDIQFLMQDLINNVPPAETAEKVKALARSKPFLRPFLKQYLAKENRILWEELAQLCETEAEANELREGLDACTWKDDWLNALKKHLQS